MESETLATVELSRDARRVVLLTATVSPDPSTPLLSVVDRGLRKRQYLAAISRWSAVTSEIAWSVVVLDNSPEPGDVGALTTELPNVQFVWCPELSQPPGVGKGVGEARLLDGMDSLLRRSPQVELVAKCTGRLFVENAHVLLSGCDVAIYASIRSDLSYLDSRFFISDVETWSSSLTGLEALVDEPRGRFIEHALLARMLCAIGAGAPRRSWPVLPRLTGMSGSSGARYGGAWGNTKRRLHDAQRRICLARPFVL